MIDPAVTFLTLFIAAIFTLIGNKIKKVSDIITLIASGFALFAVVLNLFYPFMGISILAVIGFYFTINGFTSLIALIAALIGFFVAVYSVKYIKERKSSYSFFMLVTMGSLIGMAYSWNLLWIFLLAEIATIGSAPLIAHHQKAKPYEGAIKYLIIQILAALFAVIGLGLIYQLATSGGLVGIDAFSINLLLTTGVLIGLEGKIAIFLIFLGFLVKLPSFPLHTWLPDASTVAPASISTLLHAMMIKVAGMPAFLVLFQFNFLFVSTTFWFLICGLGALTMVICVAIAFAQNDLKRLLAFDSVSQMGYVILGLGIGGLALSYYNLLTDPLWLGIAAGGIAAGLFHMFNHSLFKSILFFSAGAIEHETGTKDLHQLGGLLRAMPLTGSVMLIGSLSIAGIPLLNGFISKWMIFNACIAAGQPIFAFIAIFTSALTFAVFLRILCSVFLGNTPDTLRNVHQTPKIMVAPSAVLAAGCITFGVLPQIAIFFLIYPATLTFLPLASLPPVNPLTTILSFFGGAWDPFLIATLLLIGLIVGFLLFQIKGSTKSTETEDKGLPFTGGALQDPYLSVEETRPASTLFEYPFRSMLKKVRRTHTGLVNMYLFWFVLTALLLLALMIGGWI
jgi:formate hydrogenlyase subunit 3/multisubunit Na+/H+ antiporter MnhD subunit